MRTLTVTLTLALTALSGFAQSNLNNNVLHWNQIVGVITAPGVDNPIGGATDNNGNKVNQIHSGAGPWSTRSGSAHINLVTGEGSFVVEGLVLNGTNTSGTPGGVSSVVGTLVCNTGTNAQTAIDTAATPLSTRGDAELSFKLNVPAVCSAPLFLIRVPAGKWIATGADVTASVFSGC